jgi:bud site selection protein 20
MLFRRFFVDQTSLIRHTKSKSHKQRLKLLQERPYTQKEAEWASGMTTTSIDKIFPHKE